MQEMADGSTPRALLRVGGTTVLRQQLMLALAMRCDRIVVIAAGMHPELIGLQHKAEAHGAQFHVVPAARSLLGLVTAMDDLIVVADGLFFCIANAAELLGKGEAVLTLPIELGLAAGFERIDLNRASAGAMRISGRLVATIGDMPADCDAAAVLMRMALQSGVRQLAVPQGGGDNQFWSLIRSEADAHEIEPRWIRARTRSEGSPTLSQGLALFIARRFGAGMLHAGTGSAQLAIGALILGLMAIGAGALGHFAVGLGFGVLSWILYEVASAFAGIEADEDPGSARVRLRQHLFEWASDAMLVVFAGLGSAQHSPDTLVDRLFPPFMLIALLRLLPKIVPGRLVAILGDRALVGSGLAIAVGAGIAGPAVQIGAIVAALTGIAVPGLTKRLTRP